MTYTNARKEMIETNILVQAEDLQAVRELAEQFSYRITDEKVTEDNEIKVSIRIREPLLFNLYYLGQRIQVDKIQKLLSSIL